MPLCAALPGGAAGGGASGNLHSGSVHVPDGVVWVVKDAVIDWLLEDTNPAVAYRTKIELLDEKANNAKVIQWMKKILPDNWQDVNGLWATYYYNAIAESGLTRAEIKINKSKVIDPYKAGAFDSNCGDFMKLRALIMLGFIEELNNLGIIENLKSSQLPDGGFLCLHRIKKMKYIPKSCIKCNNLALMFVSECRKKGIKTDIENNLLEYFWKHNIFYRSDDLSTLVLDCREGWRTIDTFYPFEVMRVGIQNIIEALCVLGHGNNQRLKSAWDVLHGKRDENGRYILDGTLSKSYFPKERVGKPGKWVTFYALLAEKYT
jgi:hypothetical protein